MDASKFPAAMQQAALELDRYMRDEFPRMAVSKTLRFVEGNFRAQGWQGRSFLPWSKTQRGGTILVKSGALRRSFHGQSSPYQARVYSNSPYARVHNRGFNGTVRVKSYTRYKYTAIKQGTGRFTKSGAERTRTVHQVTGMTQVQAHERHMNIKKRQMLPESPGDSPILMDSIKRGLITGLKNIFK